MANQSALMSAMGYRNSPQRHNGRNDSVLEGFTMSPYPTNNKTQSRFPSHQTLHHRVPSSGTSSSRNQENMGSLSNQSQTQSLLWSSPNRAKGPSAAQRNTPSRGANKFSNLPSKSHTISGLGMVSPYPSKLDLSTNNGSMLLQADSGPVPISPIRPNVGSRDEQSHFVDRTLPMNHALNSTQNTLALNPNDSRMSVLRPSVGGNNGAGALVAVDRVDRDTQITVIGFPKGEAGFIHRKFASYGTILKSMYEANALFLEYERKQNAERALEENAKWICNGNLRYMIAVEYAERTELNEDRPHGPDDGTGRGGRFLNVTQLYNNRYNNQGGAGNPYFGRNYNEIEKPDIEAGPTHVFWKVFNFMTSGW